MLNLDTLRSADQRLWEKEPDRYAEAVRRALVAVGMPVLCFRCRSGVDGPNDIEKTV